MENQRGVAPRMFAGDIIEDAIDADGIGKAVMYVTGEAETVVEATADGYAMFAGVIATVGPGATISRTNANVNQGGRDVAEGDTLGIENDHMRDVLIEGEVAAGDFVTTADDGKFKKLSLSATMTAEEGMKIVGRAMQNQFVGAGGVAKVHFWVRK